MQIVALLHVLLIQSNIAFSESIDSSNNQIFINQILIEEWKKEWREERKEERKRRERLGVTLAAVGGVITLGGFVVTVAFPKEEKILSFIGIPLIIVGSGIALGGLLLLLGD